ncbi:MAG: hypothetical protein ACREIP_19605, partial [Alphaproteobacteria bacterium]
YVIGGLAMLRVLQQSLNAAFGGTFTLGAVVCMTITVTELIPEARFALLGVGAPVWGLVFGIATSLFLEPGHFRRPPEPVEPLEEPPATPEKVERPVPPVPAWALEPDPKPAAATSESPFALPPPTAPLEAAAASPSAPESDAKPTAETAPLELTEPLPAKSESAPSEGSRAESEAEPAQKSKPEPKR